MEYQKIPGPFMRDPESKKVVIGEWTSPALEATQFANDWFFTEKVDGTNVRVYWDGHRVTYKGRTDRAVFSDAQNKLLALAFLGGANETLFEQQFGATPAVLYGELYGPGVQSGGVYRDDLSVSIFDVNVGGLWLGWSDVQDVARGVGVPSVPVVLDRGDLWDGIGFVQEGFSSRVAQAAGREYLHPEGLVGRLHSGLLDRRGNRIIVKLKRVDLQ